MTSLASIPAFIKNAIDHELLKTADKIEYSIEKGEEMTTSYHLKPSSAIGLDSGDDYYAQQHALNKSYHQRPAEQSPGGGRKSRKSEFYDGGWDISTGRDSGGEYSPSSPSLASRKYTSSANSGGYREERIFSKSSTLPVTMSKHTIEYIDESGNSPIGASGGIDRSAEWTNWYNREIAPAMERNSADSSRQWQEWTKREVSTTTPVSPFEERTISYQKEQGTSLLNPNAPVKAGPNSQVIKHETFEQETSEQTFDMPEPPKPVTRSDSGFYDKFILTKERARSVSPPSLKKSVNFGSVAEISTREQEFYPFRDAHQGKPLPGDNEFGTWGRGLNDPERQWKLSNGQWVRVGGKKQRDGDVEPDLKNWEKYPKPEEPKKRKSSSSPIDRNRDKDRRSRSQGPVDFSNLDDNDPDRRALRDKYRSKPTDRNDLETDKPKDKEQPEQLLTSTGPEPEKPVYKIDLGDLIKRYEPEPEPEPEPEVVVEEPPKRIVLEPLQKVVMEPKQPVKRPTEVEEPRMDDPNLMWMKMGPAQYGPPFGSLRRRKGREEEWVGPPCELCHKQIEERRCMLAENMKFHCWHFACSFCMKTLKVNDFLIAEADKKPYCLNCHKREFPDISLVKLDLDKQT